jgi:hypothetical protein
VRTISSKWVITHRVCIPPPLDKIRGCLISRDPTGEFLADLSDYNTRLRDHAGILWFDAPPRWLCKKIRVIMEFPENSPDLIKLQDFLNSECYWTHLHKCPTKPGKNQDLGQDEMSCMKEDFPPFRYATAKSCANRWFESEFNEYGLKDKIIITLGRDVEYFFKRWSKDHGLENSNKVIHLPHPSGRCRSWNPNADHKERITDEINRLLKLI